MGLIQIARIGQMPLQQAARSSPGTLITSMQLARAVADGILIPWRKAEPEHFKTAGELLTIDKGGLTFMPPPGLHTQVAEVDFASMYPTIMAIHNISPETVNCSCCAGAVEVGEGARGKSPCHPPPHPLPQPRKGGVKVVGAGRAQSPACPTPLTGEWEGFVGAQRAVPHTSKVYGEQPPSAVMEQAGAPVLPPWPSPRRPVPEAGYRLCHRREGLVPRTLKPILALREQLKARAKEVGPAEAAPVQRAADCLEMDAGHLFRLSGVQKRPVRADRGARGGDRLWPGQAFVRQGDL